MGTCMREWEGEGEEEEEEEGEGEGEEEGGKFSLLVEVT